MEKREEVFTWDGLHEENNTPSLLWFPSSAELSHHRLGFFRAQRIQRMEQALAVAGDYPLFKCHLEEGSESVPLGYIVKKRERRHMGAVLCGTLAEALIGFNETIDGLGAGDEWAGD